MVVVGNRGTGSQERLALGSVTAGLLHHAHCPVVVVPDIDLAGRRGVIVGVDGSAVSGKLIDFAAAEAARTGDPLTVVAGLAREPFPVFLALVTIAKTGRYVALAVATLSVM